ncbi:MAG: hypothetical protein MR594_04670 [Lachnospiraceae bacterium]|nr:hypothetical protein [Lachnospiraceae bacterium]
MIFDFFKDVMKKIDKEKITQSSAVNAEGYVLDAREKNPSISGTMANQISKLNTNIKCISQKAPTGQRYLTADSGVFVTNEKNTAFTDMTARDFYEKASGHTYSLSNIGTRCVALENKLIETGWSSISYEGKEPRIKANFCKKNGICYVINNENLQNLSYPGGIWMEVGTIPKGYRPNVTIPFIGWYGLIIFIGQILTSGVIKIYCNTAIGITGNAPQFNVSYPLF